MANDEVQLDITEEVVEEETEETEEETEETDEVEEDSTDWKAEAEKAKADAAKYKAIASRKAKKKEAQPETSEQSTLTPEEIRLYARFDDTEVKAIQDIAKLKGITIKEAEESQMFRIFKEDAAEEKKNADAKLPKSGKSSTKQEKTFDSELTREEHKKLWDKSNP